MMINGFEYRAKRLYAIDAWKLLTELLDVFAGFNLIISNPNIGMAFASVLKSLDQERVFKVMQRVVGGCECRQRDSQMWENVNAEAIESPRELLDAFLFGVEAQLGEIYPDFKPTIEIGREALRIHAAMVVGLKKIDLVSEIAKQSPQT
jgi:hypothetical protein